MYGATPETCQAVLLIPHLKTNDVRGAFPIPPLAPHAWNKYMSNFVRIQPGPDNDIHLDSIDDTRKNFLLQQTVHNAHSTWVGFCRVFASRFNIILSTSP